MLKSKSIRIVALVPMKGHSERIPSKNLKHFNGVPLYHRVLTTLLSSKYIDAVVINTDGELIKEDILLHFDDKVIIHDRPKEIQGDLVSMNEIIAYDIAHEEATFYLQTHSTNPLLTVASIDKAIEKMIILDQSKLYDSIFSVTKIQTRLYDEHMKPVNHNPAELIRTQDLPPLFEENSNFYIFSKSSFINNDNKRIGKSPYMFELDKREAIDIDEPQDFVIAEAIDKVLR